MSASPIFSVVEILEQILCNLPPLDIICCQRVNSTWRQVVADSTLLQYLAWLRNDCSNPSYRIETSDFSDQEDLRPLDGAFNTKWYIHHVSQHLHPIVVSNIMKHLPENPGSDFDPLRNMDRDGFGGYFSFRPSLHRDLTQWYKRNKATENIWGKFSLFRPEARKIVWYMPDSDDSTVTIELEAALESGGYPSCQHQVIKEPGQSLSLTLSDFVGILDKVWDHWMENERNMHNWTHERGGCNFNIGIPSKKCLGPKMRYKPTSDGEDEDTDDEDHDEDENEEGEEERVTFGTKMTLEEHIERAIEAASQWP